MESLPQEHSAREGSSRGAAPPECSADLPGFLMQESANDDRMAQLARTIEREIIPRLMLAHRAPPELASVPAHAATRAQPQPDALGVEAVRQFARLVLSEDEDAALVHIATLRARQLPVEQIYLELLAPTARYLGVLWEEDLCNFTDVTVGLGRLQRVLRELSIVSGRAAVQPAGGRQRVLLLPSPGEQHTFGLVMVAEFFRRAGWDVAGGAWAAAADANTLVRDEWFDAVGFSLGAATHLQALTASIAGVRHATCNPRLAVLVGGPLFGVHPEYAQLAGADGMTIDGREAPLLAERLIGSHAARHAPNG